MSSIAPGWYDDPAGSGLQRWWSGLGWTEHTHEPAPAPASSTPSPADNFGYSGGYKPMSSTPDYSQVVAAPALVGKASGNTFGVWAIALSLFWSYLLYLPASLLAAGLSTGAAPGIAAIGSALGLYVATWFVYVALLFVFAWRDGVALRARGIASPSPAWMLLTQLGYLIRRRVVLKRDGVRSNAPGNVFAIPFFFGLICSLGLAALVSINPSLFAGIASSGALSTLEKQAAAQLDARAGGVWTVTCPPASPTTSAGASFVCTASDTAGRTTQIRATVTTPGRFTLALLTPVTPLQNS